LLLIGVLLMLASCGGSGVTETAQTERYAVQLTLDGATFGQHTATIEVRDRSNQPVDGAQVVIAPLMEVMGMASPEQTAQPVGAGRYQATGEFFSMLGEWDVDVRISAAGKDDTARFKVQVQQ
jgi:hypothetical protein